MNLIRCIRLGLLLLPLSALSAAELPAPLADAVEQRDGPQVEALLQSHVDVNAAQADGMTALHWATWFADKDTARRLIEAGADADRANRYGVKPLLLACENGDVALVRLLLAAGADPNATRAGGETALMVAARTGRLEAVECLLSNGADVQAKQRRGQTAVMWAAAEGHDDVVRALIEAGADWRTPLRSGFTPMLFAVREGRRDVVHTLLRSGADVNEAMQPDRAGGRAPRRGMSALLLAIENGHFQLALDLLEAGADPNDQRSGYTPLHAMSWVRKSNLGDGLDGQPPPQGSGNLTSLELVRHLYAAGADLNAPLARGSSGRGQLTQQGATPFFLACDTADLPFMRLLVELGADPTIPNADHCPPLLAAAGLGTLAPGEEAGTEEELLAAVTFLLELGADLNVVDDNGETVMHGAAYNNAPKVVDLLAARGASAEVWNRKNKYGWTPLLIAEGHRPGNFKPSPPTIAAIRRAMMAAGINASSTGNSPPEQDGDHGTAYDSNPSQR